VSDWYGEPHLDGLLAGHTSITYHGVIDMDLPDMEAAFEWANRLPTYGCVEVRELLRF
jgi:hypothetical protein